MTRPMPGPPGGFTDRARLNWALIGKQITYEQYQEFDNALTMASTAKPKHLTDAECAAEYWRARFDCEDYTLSDGYGDGTRAPWSGALWWPRDAMNNERRLATWHRFSTLPHALEIDGAAS